MKEQYTFCWTLLGKGDDSIKNRKSYIIYKSGGGGWVGWVCGSSRAVKPKEAKKTCKKIEIETPPLSLFIILMSGQRRHHWERKVNTLQSLSGKSIFVLFHSWTIAIFHRRKKKNWERKNIFSLSFFRLLKLNTFQQWSPPQRIHLLKKWIRTI